MRLERAATPGVLERRRRDLNPRSPCGDSTLAGSRIAHHSRLSALSDSRNHCSHIIIGLRGTLGGHCARLRRFVADFPITDRVSNLRRIHFGRLEQHQSRGTGVEDRRDHLAEPAASRTQRIELGHEREAGHLSELGHRGAVGQLEPLAGSRRAVGSRDVADRTGGRIGAERLLERGCRRIAFLGDPTTVVHVEERWRGVLDAVRAADGASARLIPIPTLTMDGGLRATQELLESPRAEWPDAIFGANDLVALGALQACLGAGVRVPEDLAIMGYDDIGFAAQAAVPLTTVRQPAYELGRVAAEILLADAGPGPDVARHVTFTPELIVRASA